MNEKKILIMDYITKEECGYSCSEELFNCDSCDNFEECYMKSCERCNDEFVKDLDYGGYDIEENFWEQLFD